MMSRAQRLCSPRPMSGQSGLTSSPPASNVRTGYPGGCYEAITLPFQGTPSRTTALRIDSGVAKGRDLVRASRHVSHPKPRNPRLGNAAAGGAETRHVLSMSQRAAS